MIRVRIKASSRLAQAGLESLLQPNSALRLVEDSDARGLEGESAPDVLLVEADTLADSTAREAIDWAAAGVPVVLLVRNPSAEPVGDALRAGIKAVLPSSLDAPEIVTAIQAAAAGLVVLEPASVETFLPAASAVSTRASGTLVEALTPRELQILQLLASGLGNKEVASRLEISEHTVKFHVASVMGKLGAGSRTEAVTLGIRHGLIMI
jgi:DNA-binding NarL/FixJ family response regulator